MLDFSILQGLTIPEGVVTQITDASGRVLWAAQSGEPIVLEVEKITSKTYAGETTYMNEQFILLDIYPKTNGTVRVTYGGVTKTIKDISGSNYPNAIPVFFGTFNGVTDSVETPTSGELTIKGDYDSFAVGAYKQSSSVQSYCGCITGVQSFGTVKYIEEMAFIGCANMKSIIIPEGITYVYDGAFNMCVGLEDITISSTVSYIDTSAFTMCRSLKSIVVEEGNPYYHSVDNCLIETSDKTLTLGCKNSIIPTDGSVTNIGEAAFHSCSSLTSIAIPAGVTSIGSSAFYGCSSLTSITIPDGVTNIGMRAFQSCAALTSITIPNSVTSILSYAFDGCSSLTSITIPYGIKSLTNQLFRNCTSLTSITIPNSVTKIGDWVFSGCPLTSITIPDGVTSFGNSVFANCTSLTSITIPNGVTKIGTQVFKNCKKLTSITIPNSLTSIGSNAFLECSGLISVVFENTYGWKAGSTSVDVSNDQNNVTLLTNTYRAYTWTRT